MDKTINCIESVLELKSVKSKQLFYVSYELLGFVRVKRPNIHDAITKSDARVWKRDENFNKQQTKMAAIKDGRLN